MIDANDVETVFNKIIANDVDLQLLPHQKIIKVNNSIYKLYTTFRTSHSDSAQIGISIPKFNSVEEFKNSGPKKILSFNWYSFRESKFFFVGISSEKVEELKKDNLISFSKEFSKKFKFFINRVNFEDDWDSILDSTKNGRIAYSISLPKTDSDLDSNEIYSGLSSISSAVRQEDQGQFSFWWVNQRANYEKERKSKILLANEFASDGTRRVFRDSLRLMRPGDVVFHNQSANIKSISTVQDYAKKVNDNAYQVPLDEFVDINFSIKEIIPLFSENHEYTLSPVHKGGNVNSGYLYFVPYEVGINILNLLSKEGEINKTISQFTLSSGLSSKVRNTLDRDYSSKKRAKYRNKLYRRNRNIEILRKALKYDEISENEIYNSFLNIASSFRGDSQKNITYLKILSISGLPTFFLPKEIQDGLVKYLEDDITLQHIKSYFKDSEVLDTMNHFIDKELRALRQKDWSNLENEFKYFSHSLEKIIPWNLSTDSCAPLQFASAAILDYISSYFQDGSNESIKSLANKETRTLSHTEKGDFLDPHREIIKINEDVNIIIDFETFLSLSLLLTLRVYKGDKIRSYISSGLVESPEEVIPRNFSRHATVHGPHFNSQINMFNSMVGALNILGLANYTLSSSTYDKQAVLHFLKGSHD